PRCAAVLLGGAGTTERQADPGARRAERHLPRAGRCGWPDRAVELPDADPVLGHGTRASRGVHRRGQARRGHPADRDADRFAGPGSRPARGGVPGAAGQGQRGRAAPGRPPRGAEDRLHRVHRGGPADHGRLRAPGQAAHPGARRQERQHRLRRRRPGEGRGDRAVRGVRQRRAGLLCPVPDPGPALGPGQVHGAVRARGPRPGGRRSRLGGDRDGTADLGGAPIACGLVRAGRRSVGFQRPRARRARLLVPADGARAGAPGRPGLHRGGVRPGGDRDPVLGRGRGGGHRQRHALRIVWLDLDPRRGPGDPRRPRGGEREPVGELAFLGALLDAVRRLQAVRPRPRARPRRPGRVHRNQERLHLYGGLMRFEGRTVVITGAGSGIGLATARRFAADGAHVVAVDIDDAAGEKAAAETSGLYVHADVTSETDVAAAFRAAHDAFGSVDVAFNNAGISPPDDDSILDTGLEAWRRVQEVNLTSVYLCCKEAIGYMRAQGKGAIVNTASFVAVVGSATSQISYTASKGGVLALSRELGVQFAREGIRVNALCPGPVNTPLLRELFAADPERAQRRLVHVPMGRFAEPEEIAAAVAFLASDDASFITASTFLVDGGISGAYVTPLKRRAVRVTATGDCVTT